MSTHLTLAGNPNYAARIIEVKNLVTLDNLDNLRGVPIDGFQALVPKDTEVGDVLVVFPAEAQIEDWFLRDNNLYRHSEKNLDPEVVGYIEDNRRVRAIRLRGHQSNALAMPGHLVGATKEEVGTLFDTVEGSLLSQKYELPTKGHPGGKSAQEKAWKRVDATFLPEHLSTENYWRNAHNIGPDEFVTVTQKIHGTSIRIGNTIVKRKPTWKDKIATFFGVPVSLTGYDVVFGSRKVIKDVNNPNQNHFYAHDIWSEQGAKYADLIPQNVVVYGELIGWTKDGAPIQQGYTYNVPKGEAHLYIYRVAVISNDGHMYDLSWNGVKQFAFERGLNVVPELWSGKHEAFDADKWIDIRFADHLWIEGALPLSDKKTVDEGVVVRKEGILPYVLKAKSPIFLGHESALLDDEVVDLETEGSHAV